jgi:hypothetical protein
MGGGDVVIEGEGDSILLGVSIPAAPLVAFRDFLGPLVTFEQERFFNGKAKLSLAVVDGTPKITVKALTLAGKELPEMGLTSASASLEGYLRDAINDASGVSLNKVKSLAVVDGKIVIELR